VPIEGIHAYYLRTSNTTDGTGYHTIDDARTALRTLVRLERDRGHAVEEQPDGRWVSHQQPTGSISFWLEDDGENTVRL